MQSDYTVPLWRYIHTKNPQVYSQKKVHCGVACEIYWHEETPFFNWVGHMIGIWQRLIA